MKSKVQKNPKFVIQKHETKRPHFDLRLEVEGVLKSWAIPKGPSTSPKVKRLAMMTDDHALSYGDFEGVIPEGKPGAGKVSIWDKGTYRNLKNTPMQKCIEEGQIEIEFNGKKLNGGYALIRFQSEKDWLLIKKRKE